MGVSGGGLLPVCCRLPGHTMPLPFTLLLAGSGVTDCQVRSWCVCIGHHSPPASLRTTTTVATMNSLPLCTYSTVKPTFSSFCFCQGTMPCSFSA